MVRRIPRWFARAPIPLFRAGFAGVCAGVRALAHVLDAAESHELLERYRREHPVRGRFVARALGIPGLRTQDPLPSDFGERVPLVRITTLPR